MLLGFNFIGPKPRFNFNMMDNRATAFPEIQCDKWLNYLTLPVNNMTLPVNNKTLNNTVKIIICFPKQIFLLFYFAVKSGQ